MLRTLIAMLLLALPLSAAEIKGSYLEARTCDVYTGACFANADTGITGRNGVMAWKIESGTFEGVKLDGLTVVAVLSASDTLGQKQSRTPKSIVLVDKKASSEQRETLVKFVRDQAKGLLDDIIAIRQVALKLTMCECKGNSCAKLESDEVTIETRCLDKEHDRGCGNDVNFYKPLSRNVIAKAAMASDHAFNGKDFGETWSDSERRGAYVGTFKTE